MPYIYIALVSLVFRGYSSFCLFVSEPFVYTPPSCSRRYRSGRQQLYIMDFRCTLRWVCSCRAHQLFTMALLLDSLAGLIT
ncbi:hypothetical protein C0J52_24940 [Blattella germanica]|nr:hypothetical protein C0J52_24940 [Blattella germanica]